MSFPDLVSIYRHRDRIGPPLAPGIELTPRLLTRLDLLRSPAPPSRPDSIRRDPALRAPRPIISPVETLKHIDWSALPGRLPNSASWVAAWADDEFQQTVSMVIRRDFATLAADPSSRRTWRACRTRRTATPSSNSWPTA